MVVIGSEAVLGDEGKPAGAGALTTTPEARVQVTVLPAGWTFPADRERPLLASAKAAGVVLPAMCRNGTCRMCLCRMTGGRVAYRIEWPGLLAEEKAAGWILPCVAHPLGDLVVEQPGAKRPDGR